MEDMIKLEKKMITRDNGYYFVIMNEKGEYLCKKTHRYWFDSVPNKHTLIHHKEFDMLGIVKRLENCEVVKVKMILAEIM